MKPTGIRDCFTPRNLRLPTEDEVPEALSIVYIVLPFIALSFELLSLVS